MAKFDFQKILSTLTSRGVPVVVGVGAIAGGAWCLKSSVYGVDAGHMAVKYNRLFGVGDGNYREGVHVLIPWVERPIIFDVRARPHTLTSLTGSKDLQMVNISLRALCKPDAGKLAEIYRQIGLDYEEKVMPSIANEVLKSVVAQYNASQLIMQRELVSRMIRQRLVERAKDFNILLDDVAITHLSFSPEYEKAVEQKQVAHQQAERAKYLVLKANEEKKRTIIHAEGEQESARLIGEAMRSNPGFLELRRISKAKEVAELLAKSSNRMILSAEGLLMNTLGESTMQMPMGASKK